METKTSTIVRAPAGAKPVGWEPTGVDTPAVSADDRTGQISEEFRDLQRQREAGVPQSDLKAAFGEPIDEGNGKIRWSVDTRNRRNRGLVKELTAPRRRVMLERAGKVNARKKVTLRDRETGQERVVLEEFEDLAGRSGNLKSTRRPGGLKVVTGSGGMLFRQAGGGRWEPTGRKCLGTPLDGSDPVITEYPQIAPDGSLWLRGDDGGWFTHPGGE